MGKIDKLKELVQESISPASVSKVSLEIRADEKIDVIVRGLKDYFATDDQRESIRVVFDDGGSGWLKRKDLYKLVSLSNRDFSDSDGATIPGNPSHIGFIRLCCQHEGCDHVLLVTSFDEDAPPRYCEDHEDTTLKVCDESD